MRTLPPSHVNLTINLILSLSHAEFQSAFDRTVTITLFPISIGLLINLCCGWCACQPTSGVIWVPAAHLCMAAINLWCCKYILNEDDVTVASEVLLYAVTSLSGITFVLAFVNCPEFLSTCTFEVHQVMSAQRSDQQPLLKSRTEKIVSEQAHFPQYSVNDTNHPSPVIVYANVQTS